ncbi:MAG: galactose mutarotase, partial [Bacteroidales bacterium]|nr:galactose mutarotase [Bacteroidales bacterium]
LSLTLHPYFNLGNRPDSVADHLLYIPSSRRLEMDAAFLPTGRQVEVQGTPFDFTRPARIGQYAGQLCDELVWSRGYNHCYPIPDPKFPAEYLPLAESFPLAESLPLAAQLTAPDSGRVLSIYTNLPGILVYSGGFLPQPESAVALEAQFWPDTPGHADFPSCLLRPGMRYLRHICFAFGISQA